MAAYPTLPTQRGSDPEPARGGLDIDRAEDGTARGRSWWAADKCQFKLVHPRLTAAERSTLDTFYAANRLVPFDYTSLSDGVTRTCIFAAAPAPKGEAGGRWTMTVELVEV